MIWSLILLALCRHGWTFKSPCTDDSHCDENYYCETRGYQCVECLRCEDFMRAAPSVTTDCVKSIVECGPCAEGDKNGGDCVMNVKNINDNKSIVTKEFGTRDFQLPVYAWVIIGIIVVVVVTVVFLLKTTIMNKMTYSIVCRTARQRSTTEDCPASAPEPPPAYHAVYDMESSALLIDTAKLEHESDIFIKPVVDMDTPTEENRETSGRQAAMPFNHPAYVRSGPMSSSNSPSTNGAVATDEMLPHDDAVGDISTVDGPSGVDTHEDIAPHPTNNRTDTAGDSRHSGYSNMCTEPNSSHVIFVNNIVNLQGVSISEKSSSS